MKKNNYTDCSLCQDCLAINSLHPTNEGTCKCGGDTCSCKDCQRTIRLLFKGVRDSKVLGVKGGNLETWNKTTGVR